MFVLQKQLSVLNVPISRVAILFRSASDIQLALPELPPQMGSAYLVMLKGGGRVQVLVGLYMMQSCRNVFYVSDSGEVGAEQAEQELAEGQFFAESMGFILNDAELGRMPLDQQDAYWKALPICQRNPDSSSELKVTEIKADVKTPESKVSAVIAPQAKAPESSRIEVAISSKPSASGLDIQKKRMALKEHLGKLLASL